MYAYDIRPEDEKKRFIEYDHSSDKGLRNTGIWKHVKKDGSLIYAEVNSHTMTIDNKAARLVLSIDITHRKNAEERLDFALEAGQIGIWELDLVNNIAVRNLQHDQIFGYEEIQPVWNIKKFLGHIYPDDKEKVENSFMQSLITKSWMVETKIIRTDNVCKWILIKGKIIEDNNGKPLKMLGTIIDISNLKSAEAEIRALNTELEQRVEVRTRELHAANKELESFSYSVSHDLRAPLRAINGYSQLLQEGYTSILGDEGNRLLSRVMFGAKKMGRLIALYYQLSPKSFANSFSRFRSSICSCFCIFFL